MERDRRNFRRELGVENAAYKDAGAFYTMITIMNDLVKNNGPLVDYEVCNRLLLIPLFGIRYGVVADFKRRCIWAIDVQPCDLPKALPAGIDEIRTIWTFHYRWFFSVHNTAKRRWVDIRKPRGRLAMLDLVDSPAASRGRYLQDKAARRAALNGITTTPNIPPIETETAFPAIDTEIGRMTIVDDQEQNV